MLLPLPQLFAELLAQTLDQGASSIDSQIMFRPMLSHVVTGAAITLVLAAHAAVVVVEMNLPNAAAGETDVDAPHLCCCCLM